MKKRYRFLTGPDDATFCQRVSDALDEGYQLYGDPVMVVSDGDRVCGQAVILPDTSIGGDRIGDGNHEDD